MGLAETEGIVLRNIRLGEADKIVTILSRQEGVVRGVARGARRLKSRFGASLEPFTHIHLTFYEKEARELVNITNAEIIKSYFELTCDDRVLVPLEYLAGIIIEFAPLRAPDERLFRLMSAALRTLAADSEDVGAVVRYCEVWALKLGGFLPDMTRCAVCRRNFGDGRDAPLLGVGSALVCRACSGGKGTAVSPETLRRIASALQASPEAWARAEKSAFKSGESEAHSLVRTLLTRALEREPKVRFGL